MPTIIAWCLSAKGFHAAMPPLFFRAPVRVGKSVPRFHARTGLATSEKGIVRAHLNCFFGVSAG
jgi:hypothetical protein